MAELLLFTRRGCCLCEGLEEKLTALQPPLMLRCVDIDTDPALKARYDLLVPVLALVENRPDVSSGESSWRELPRVPPRLCGDRLRQWLDRHGAGPSQTIGS